MILKYISSRGREFSFMSSGLKVKESNFHSSGWTPEGREIEYGLRVSRFKREPVTYQAQLVLMGTQEENFTLLDAFHDARVFDIRNRRPGKVYWNSYYAECYITSIDPQPDEFRQKVNIEVYCPYPFWIKEEVVKFYDSASYMDSGFLDYEYDYNHDYKGRTAGEGRITNDTSVPCKIKIRRGKDHKRYQRPLQDKDHDLWAGNKSQDQHSRSALQCFLHPGRRRDSHDRPGKRDGDTGDRGAGKQEEDK